MLQAADDTRLTAADLAEIARARGRSWSRNRMRALYNAHFCCTYPGCRARQSLEVHHVIPLRWWPACQEAEANALDNLRVLCRAHHREFERLVDDLEAHPDALPDDTHWRTRRKLAARKQARRAAQEAASAWLKDAPVSSNTLKIAEPTLTAIPRVTLWARTKRLVGRVVFRLVGYVLYLTLLTGIFAALRLIMNAALHLAVWRHGL